MVAIRGHFDGKVLVPDEPVDLPQGRALIFHVEVPQSAAANGDDSLWAVLDRHTGSVEAPPDWSSEHDHYLYGTPKHGSNIKQ
jgi:hypothetical protein